MYQYFKQIIKRGCLTDMSVIMSNIQNTFEFLKSCEHLITEEETVHSRIIIERYFLHSKTSSLHTSKQMSD